MQLVNATQHVTKNLKHSANGQKNVPNLYLYNYSNLPIWSKESKNKSNLRWWNPILQINTHYKQTPARLEWHIDAQCNHMRPSGV